MSSETSRLPRSLVLLMAMATGLAVASNYYAQPLLQMIGKELGINEGHAGLIVTAAQLAYAAGLMLLVPLGDRLDRRTLVISLYLFSAVGLVINGLANNFTWLLIGTVISGACSVCAQILVPFAATLAAPQERGRAIGTVMSGLLLGILLARTVAGVLADIGGWHCVYWVAAALIVLVSALLWKRLPSHPGQSSLSYPRLVGSVLVLLKEDPVLRARSVLGGLLFAGFSIFWTTLAFLLAGPDYGYSPSVIGLFGLIGAAGALTANLSGKLSDHGRGHWVTWGGLTVLLLSWLLMWFAPTSLIALIVGVILLDVAVQGVHIGSQSVIYARNPEARNRITSAYMTCYFIGGALGSSAGAAAYDMAGWNGVAAVGSAVAVLTLLWTLLTAHHESNEAKAATSR